VSWRTVRPVLALRNVGRTLGLNRLVGIWFARGAYEDRFQAAMLAAIRPGDVVWDVGANVGLYARKFSDIAGPSGKVFAYEPSPANLQRLNEAVASRANVIVVPFALGARDGVAAFEQGKDPLGATSRIVDDMQGDPEERFEIRLASGDQLVSSGVVAIPNVIKIDTEGFELDVLLGLPRTLREKYLRVLCIEVHFGLLEARGLSDAPSDIERVLVSAGFRVDWPDASHIVATRAR